MLFDNPNSWCCSGQYRSDRRVGEVTDTRTEALLHDFVEACEVFVAPGSRGAHA